ncbi:hypothetical protein BS47DRAFT_1351314, partial [Hydnum rufescens UP504]
MLRCMEKSIARCIHSVAPAESLRCRNENNGASSWRRTAIPFLRRTRAAARPLGSSASVRNYRKFVLGGGGRAWPSSNN